MSDSNPTPDAVEDARLPLQMYADEVPKKDNKKLVGIVIGIFGLVVILGVVAALLWAFLGYEEIENPLHPKDGKISDDPNPPYQYANVAHNIDWTFSSSDPDSFGLDPGCICPLKNGNYMLYKR